MADLKRNNKEKVSPKLKTHSKVSPEEFRQAWINIKGTGDPNEVLWVYEFKVVKI